MKQLLFSVGILVVASLAYAETPPIRTTTQPSTSRNQGTTPATPQHSTTPHPTPARHVETHEHHAATHPTAVREVVVVPARRYVETGTPNNTNPQSTTQTTDPTSGTTSPGDSTSTPSAGTFASDRKIPSKPDASPDSDLNGSFVDGVFVVAANTK